MITIYLGYAHNYISRWWEMGPYWFVGSAALAAVELGLESVAVIYYLL